MSMAKGVLSFRELASIAFRSSVCKSLALKSLALAGLSLAALACSRSGNLGFCASSGDHYQAPGIDLRVPDKGGLERAVFAGGCFWGTQYSFQKLGGISLEGKTSGGKTNSESGAKSTKFKEQPKESSGIVSTTVGFTGGHFKDPTYRDVCSSRTGHAEAVLVVFDPKKVSYKRLVEYFFGVHDPTTKDRQGPDFGSQYRSAIFYTTPKQREVAQSVISEFLKSRKFSAPIVTQLAPGEVFYPAEEYHQSYDLKQGSESCPFPQGN